MRKRTPRRPKRDPLKRRVLSRAVRARWTRRSEKRRKRERRRQQTERRKAKRAARGAPRRALTGWAEQIREDFGNTCAVCGVGVRRAVDKHGNKKTIRTGPRAGQPVMVHLNAHHLLPKERYREFRCERINGVLLCPQHHKYDKFSAHRNPIWFVVWLKNAYPERYAWCVKNMGKVKP